jgi:hypothetical protein
MISFVIGLALGFLLGAWITHVGLQGAAADVEADAHDLSKKL